MPRLPVRRCAVSALLSLAVLIPHSAQAQSGAASAFRRGYMEGMAWHSLGDQLGSIGESVGQIGDALKADAADRRAKDAEIQAARAAFWAKYRTGGDYAAEWDRLSRALFEKDKLYLYLMFNEVFTREFAEGMGDETGTGVRARILRLLPKLAGDIDGGIPVSTQESFSLWVDGVILESGVREAYSLMDWIRLVPNFGRAFWTSEANLKLFQHYVVQRDYYEFARVGRAQDFWGSQEEFEIFVVQRASDHILSVDEARAQLAALRDLFGPAAVDAAFRALYRAPKPAPEGLIADRSIFGSAADGLPSGLVDFDDALRLLLAGQTAHAYGLTLLWRDYEDRPWSEALFSQFRQNVLEAGEEAFDSVAARVREEAPTLTYPDVEFYHELKEVRDAATAERWSRAADPFAGLPAVSFSAGEEVNRGTSWRPESGARLLANASWTISAAPDHVGTLYVMESGGMRIAYSMGRGPGLALMGDTLVWSTRTNANTGTRAGIRLVDIRTRQTLDSLFTDDFDVGGVDDFGYALDASGGRLLVASADAGRYYLIDIGTRRLEWSFETTAGYRVREPPQAISIVGGRALVREWALPGRYVIRLVDLDAHSMTPLSGPGPHFGSGAMALSQERVFVSAPDSRSVLAFDARDGRLLYTLTDERVVQDPGLRSVFGSALTVADGKVFVSDREHRAVYVYDQTDGRKLGRVAYGRPGEAVTTPWSGHESIAVAGAKLLIADADDERPHLYAVSADPWLEASAAASVALAAPEPDAPELMESTPGVVQFGRDFGTDLRTLQVVETGHGMRTYASATAPCQTGRLGPVVIVDALYQGSFDGGADTRLHLMAARKKLEAMCPGIPRFVVLAHVNGKPHGIYALEERGRLRRLR